MEVIVVAETPKTGNKWHDLPLVEALHQFADLREELKKASEVITRRTDLLPKIATCWVALHHKDMAELPGIHTAYEKCVKRFPDGLSKFTDNCHLSPITGLVDPIHCCSGMCHAIYQTYLSRLKMGLVKPV